MSTLNGDGGILTTDPFAERRFGKMITQSLSDQKLDLIVQITKLSKEKSVHQVKEFVEHLEKGPTDEQMEMLKKIAKPMRKKMDIEELKGEQNWKPVNREEFDRLIREIDIKEPLEQLIADIGR